VGEAVTYFAVTFQGTPAGVARRRSLTDGGIEDEMLRHDMTWQRDSLITEWKRGDATEELAEITEGEAEGLIEKFREQWCRLAPAPARRPANRAQPRRERRQRVGLPLCVELTPLYGGQSLTKR
jgi:hypothetical protein